MEQGAILAPVAKRKSQKNRLLQPIKHVKPDKIPAAVQKRTGEVKNDVAFQINQAILEKN